MGHRKVMLVTCHWWQIPTNKRCESLRSVSVLANQVVVEWSRWVNFIAAWCERPLTHWSIPSRFSGLVSYIWGFMF